MAARILTFAYGLLCYAVFVAAFVYALGFFGNDLVHKSIDAGGPASSLAPAIIVDVLLLAGFAIQHSVMARPIFKQWWNRIVPPACERSTYVLLASLLLLLLFWQWRPITFPVWRLDGLAASLIVGIYWIGWLVVLASTFMIDHFDLSGLRQAFAALRGIEPGTPAFRTPLLYRYVRHPLMLGFLLVFWATPEMTAGHLLFAVLSSAYILIGVQFEERDLLARFGTTYAEYRERVPSLLPRPMRSSRRTDGSATDALTPQRAYSDK